MTEDEMMAVNCSFEKYRKAMIRAAKDKQQVVEQAGKFVFILVRTHNDNLINRRISTPIAVSDSKRSLIEFCHRLYGADVEFDDSYRSNSVETDMGEAKFCIQQVAFLDCCTQTPQGREV